MQATRPTLRTKTLEPRADVPPLPHDAVTSPIAVVQATTSSYTLAKAHPIAWAVGHSVAQVGKTLANHPFLVVAGTTAAYAGACATGLLTDDQPGRIWIAMAPFGVALINWMTNAGLAGPILAAGARTLFNPLVRDLRTAQIKGDLAMANGVSDAVVKVNARYQPTAEALAARAN